MRTYVLRRVLLVVPTLVGISLLGFAVFHLAPGDPATQYVIRVTGAQPTPAALQQARHELGLDRPLPAQYAGWLGDVAAGDLGISYATQAPVARSIAQRVPITMQLAVPAALLALVVAVPLGAVAALQRNRRTDHVLRLAAVAGASVPSFALALLLIGYFAVRLSMVPVAGRSGWASAVLPVVVLAAAPTALLARFTRSMMLEALSEDYARTARAKGVGTGRLVFRHTLRNSLVPVLTAFGTALGHLLSGTVIVETIFGWPGLGRLALDAILERDYPLIQGFLLYSALAFVVINLLVDLTYGIVDPRVRAGPAVGARA